MSIIRQKTLGDRLSEAFQETGVAVQDVASRAEINRGYIYKLMKGEALNPSPEVIAKLCRAMRLNEAWLTFGVGDMINEVLPLERQNEPSSVHSRALDLSLINTAFLEAMFKEHGEKLLAGTPERNKLLENLNVIVMELRRRTTTESKSTDQMAAALARMGAKDVRDDSAKRGPAPGAGGPNPPSSLPGHHSDQRQGPQPDPAGLTEVERKAGKVG